MTSLPGYVDFTGKFEMFSGLLPLKADPLINMHYVFVTSMSNTSANDPVVVWLNGGPGCSSLLGNHRTLYRLHTGIGSVSDAPRQPRLLQINKPLRLEPTRQHPLPRKPPRSGLLPKLRPHLLTHRTGYGPDRLQSPRRMVQDLPRIQDQ